MQANLNNALFATTAFLTLVMGVILVVLGPQNFEDDEAAMSEMAAAVIGPAFWVLLGITAAWGLAMLVTYVVRRRGPPSEM